jgi:LacI family transcriptional regulator
MTNATIKDVAIKAGVSETTVSLAFKEKSRISQKTREKVFAVAEELDYIPNLAAKNLRNGPSKTIGFVVNDITNPFYSQMLREAEELAVKHGYSVVFAGSNWSADKEKHLFEQMVQMRVCGVIMCLCEKSRESIEILDRFKVPYIAVDSYPDWYKGPYVANDFRMAGELAATHLLEQGCRAPAYFTSSGEMKKLSPFSRMSKHFIGKLRENGIKINKQDVIEAGLSIKEGHKTFESIAGKNKNYDGIFCANDLCAMGVMESAEKQGIIPGKDIALVGIDDIEVSSFSRVSLTSIRQPYDRIARIATEELIKSVESGSKPDIRIELPAELIVRNSSKLSK